MIIFRHKWEQQQTSYSNDTHQLQQHNNHTSHSIISSNNYRSSNIIMNNNLKTILPNPDNIIAALKLVNYQRMLEISPLF
jgi:hypothetical protein